MACKERYDLAQLQIQFLRYGLTHLENFAAHELLQYGTCPSVKSNGNKKLKTLVKIQCPKSKPKVVWCKLPVVLELATFASKFFLKLNHIKIFKQIYHIMA